MSITQHQAGHRRLPGRCKISFLSQQDLEEKTKLALRWHKPAGDLCRDSFLTGWCSGGSAACQKRVQQKVDLVGSKIGQEEAATQRLTEECIEREAKVSWPLTLVGTLHLEGAHPPS
jgi:hypothetical protein